MNNTQDTNSNEEAESDRTSESGNSRSLWKWGITILGLGLVMFLFFHFDLRTKFRAYFQNVITPWIDAHPVFGVVVYFGVYVTAVVAFLPGSIVTVAGGALFGPILGTIVVSVSSTTAAAIAFLIARYAAKGWVEKKAGERIDTIQEGIRKEGWRFVAFTRLVPVFPFSLQNYVYGLTRVHFWTYVFVSWVAMLPGTFAYVYAGYAAKVAAAGGAGVKKTLLVISIAAGVLILVSMIPKWLKGQASDELQEEMEEQET